MVEPPLLEGNAAALLDEKLTDEKLTGANVPAANGFEAEPRNELELNAGKAKAEVPKKPLGDAAGSAEFDAELDADNDEKAVLPNDAGSALNETPALED